MLFPNLSSMKDETLFGNMEDLNLNFEEKNTHLTNKVEDCRKNNDNLRGKKEYSWKNFKEKFEEKIGRSGK